MTRPGISVQLTDVHKRFGDTVALAGLTLIAPSGEVTGVLGPNGAGKTTALEICAGLQRAHAGTVAVGGRDPWRAPAAHRAQVGMMLQTGGVWPAASPLQAITHVARMYTDPLPVTDLVERLHLERVARRQFRRLSGGEQQRVKLACALVGRPPLAILDEPTAGLDPAVRRDVHELVRELRATGVTIVLSTHSLPEAEDLSDTIVIVHEGAAVATGTPSQLTADPDGQSLRFRAPPHLDRAGLLRALPAEFHLVEEIPGRYVLTGALIAPATLATVTAWCAERGILASEVTVQARDLEQVFLELTAERQPAP